MRRWHWIPLALVLLVVVALPAAALTQTGIEKDVRSTLGLDREECEPVPNLASLWTEGPALEINRDEPRIGVIEGQVYLVGGVTEVVHERGGQPDERLLLTPSDKLTRFEPSTGRYTELAPLPEPLNHVGVVVYRGDLYVLGGYGQRVDANTGRHFYRYDPQTDRWSSMPDLPEPRAAMAVGVIDHTLVMAGGARDRVAVSGSYAFDFHTGRWSQLPPMHSRREHVGDAVVGDKLYVLGGRAPYSLAVDTAERFDLATRKWEVLPRMLVPAGGLAAVADDGKAIAIGGGNDERATVTGAVQEFDPEDETWSLLPSLRIARHGHGAALADNRLWVFGGSDCPYFHATDAVEWLENPLEGQPRPAAAGD